MPICVSEPIGLARPRRTAITPATNVVATAPIPGNNTPSLPRAGTTSTAAFDTMGFRITSTTAGSQARVRCAASSHQRVEVKPHPEVGGGARGGQRRAAIGGERERELRGGELGVADVGGEVDEHEARLLAAEPEAAEVALGVGG